MIYIAQMIFLNLLSSSLPSLSPDALPVVDGEPGKPTNEFLIGGGGELHGGWRARKVTNKSLGLVGGGGGEELHGWRVRKSHQ